MKTTKRLSLFIKISALVLCFVFVLGLVFHIFFGQPKATTQDERKVVLPVIFSKAEDNYDISALGNPTSKTGVYLSPALREKRVEYRGQNVLYGVFVEVFVADGGEWSGADFTKETQQLWKDSNLALAEYHKAKDIGNQKEAEQSYAIWDDLNARYLEAKKAELEVIYKSLMEKRKNMLNSVYGKEAVFIEQTDEYRAVYYAELSRDMINELAVSGGFAFRLSNREIATESF